MIKRKTNNNSAVIQAFIGGIVILLGLLLLMLRKTSVSTPISLIIIGSGCMSLGFRKRRNNNEK